MKDIGLQRRKQRAVKVLTDHPEDLTDGEIVDIVVKAYAAANASEHAYDYKVAGDALRQSHKVTW